MRVVIEKSCKKTLCYANCRLEYLLLSPIDLQLQGIFMAMLQSGAKRGQLTRISSKIGIFRVVLTPF